MADGVSERVLDGDDVSEAVEELHKTQMAQALADAINQIVQLQENLQDVLGTGDPARWVGVRRRAAAWRLVLDTLKNDLHRQHNALVPPDERIERS